MTIEEKVGQMFLVRYPNNGVIKQIKEEAPGGYILFGKDFDNETKEKSELLKSIGLNMNLAPVVDVPTKTSSFIYERSYGRAAEEPCILVSHNIVKSMDENYPASLSENVHKILREVVSFSGIIMTDDLSMEAVKTYTENGDVAVQAVLAGNDMLISSNFVEQKQEILKAIEENKISENIINKAVRRILSMKIAYEIIDNI